MAIEVQFLEHLGANEKEQKSEYSLTQHLESNMIDLYINLPSKQQVQEACKLHEHGLSLSTYGCRLPDPAHY